MNVTPISPTNIGQLIGTVQNNKTAANVAGDTAQQVTKTFSDVLNNLNETQKGSDALMQKLAAGEDVDLHQVMIATEETDVSFRVAMAIRDRLVEAYKEVARMQV